MPCYHKSMSTFLCSLLFYSHSVESSGGITLDFFHRDSGHSPSYDPSSKRFQRLRHAFDCSLSRKSWLTTTFAFNIQKGLSRSDQPCGVRVPDEDQGWDAPVEQLAITDMGSDLTWIQCKPCIHYNQTLPLFDPSHSLSYRPVSCGSHNCTASCGSKNTCQYEFHAADGSYSYGELATETLTFDGGVSFPNLAFGCGRENGYPISVSTASGIVGLGAGSTSIINQLKKSVGGKFSYCLYLRDSNATSKISFGSSAVVAGPKVVSTPLLRKSLDTFHYLILERLSVGRERVGGMNVGSSNEGNTIIESGTTLSFVPDEMYNRVDAALNDAVKGERIEDPQKEFGLCYKKGGGFRSPPPITAHFKNAAVVLAQESIFLEVEKGIVCITLMPSHLEDFAIFGNLHQMNYRIGFDLEKRSQLSAYRLLQLTMIEILWFIMLNQVLLYMVFICSI